MKLEFSPVLKKVTILRQINPVRALLSYVLKVYFNNFLSTSPLGFSTCVLSVKMQIKNSVQGC